MLKQIFIILVVLSLSFSSFAQNIEGINARLDAMGGSAPSLDIGWTIKHPANICDWGNQVQSTICLMDIAGLGVTYGSIIGIIKFNELLYVGVNLNNRTMINTLQESWYEEAALFLDLENITGAEDAKDFTNLPYVNLGLKINDNLKLGIGSYSEAAGEDYEATKKIGYIPVDTTKDSIIEYTELRDGKRIRNHGVIAEAKITVGPLTIYPQVTVGFPKIRGEDSDDILDQAEKQLKESNAQTGGTYANTDSTWDSPKALYVRGASYFWTDIGSTFWITGVIYEMLQTQFKKTVTKKTGQLNGDGSLVGDYTTTTVDSIRPERNDNWIHFFLAFTPSFSDNLYFAPEYDAGFGWYKAKDPDTSPDTTFYTTYHNFRLGIEKYIDNFWWFDKIGLRCGIVAAWLKQWRHIVNGNDEISVSDDAFPWKSYLWGSNYTNKQAKVTGGFGITKGRGTLDISCDFLKWQGQGVLTGPSAAMASLTVNFSKKYKSAEAAETPPPPAPSVISSYEEPIEETAPEPEQTPLPESDLLEE